MSVQTEKLEKNMAKLTIEVLAEELEKEIQNVYMKQKNKISIPGFRKGKAPRQLIEKMYGPEVFYGDAADAIISREYAKAYDECGLEIVSQPDIGIEQLEKGKPFIFTAKIATKPEVTLGEYKGLKVGKADVEVTDKDIEGRLKNELEMNARMVPVTGRAAKDGDQVIIDYEGFINGVPFEGGKAENYELTIGSGTFIPGFEEQLIGAMAEQEKEVNVTFPKDYHDSSVAGSDAVFKCFIHEIREKEIPELDDEFAAEVSEFDTLDEYKADLRKKLEEEKTARAHTIKENQAIAKAVENASMEIPDAMVETVAMQMINEYLQRISYRYMSMQEYTKMTGVTREQMIESFRPQALMRIKSGLVLEEIAKKEGLEVSEEMVDEEIAKMAETYHMEPEKCKEQMREEDIDNLKKELMAREAANFLAEHSIEEEASEEKPGDMTEANPEETTGEKPEDKEAETTKEATEG